MLKSLIIAFSTYSRIPMPQFEWQEKNMRYSMCFFPVIGLVIGALSLLAEYAADMRGMSRVFTGMCFTVIPLLVTGGIHMDGFLDTVDARRSYRGKEARLEILKDPHVGAFAVIYGIVMVLVEFGCFTEISHNGLVTVCIGYVISRCLSGLAVITFPKARKNGMLRSVSDAAEQSRRRVCAVLAAELTAAVSVLLYLQKIRSVPVIISGALVFLYYRRMCVREFGGTTGDLAGWFLTVCEAVMLLTAVICGV